MLIYLNNLYLFGYTVKLIYYIYTRKGISIIR